MSVPVRSMGHSNLQPEEKRKNRRYLIDGRMSFLFLFEIRLLDFIHPRLDLHIVVQESFGRQEVGLSWRDAKCGKTPRRIPILFVRKFDTQQIPSSVTLVLSVARRLLECESVHSVEASGCRSVRDSGRNIGYSTPTKKTLVNYRIWHSARKCERS